jgi:hypothetical protein
MDFWQFFPFRLRFFFFRKFSDPVTNLILASRSSRVVYSWVTFRFRRVCSPTRKGLAVSACPRNLHQKPKTQSAISKIPYLFFMSAIAFLLMNLKKAIYKSFLNEQLVFPFQCVLSVSSARPKHIFQKLSDVFFHKNPKIGLPHQTSGTISVFQHHIYIGVFGASINDVGFRNHQRGSLDGIRAKDSVLSFFSAPCVVAKFLKLFFGVILE